MYLSLSLVSFKRKRKVDNLLQLIGHAASATGQEEHQGDSDNGRLEEET